MDLNSPYFVCLRPLCVKNICLCNNVFGLIHLHQNIYLMVNIDNLIKSFWVCTIWPVIKCAKNLKITKKKLKYAYFLLIFAYLSLEIQSKLLIIHQNIFIMVNIDISFKRFWVCTILPVIKCPKTLKLRKIAKICLFFAYCCQFIAGNPK